jgi:hypothetical protein
VEGSYAVAADGTLKLIFRPCPAIPYGHPCTTQVFTGGVSLDGNTIVFGFDLPTELPAADQGGVSLYVGVRWPMP